jgi:hypothetical protein
MGLVFADTIRDIKPPVYFRANYAFLLLAIAALVLLLMAFFFWLYIKKHRKNKTGSNDAPKLPAHEIAYTQLKELKSKSLPEFGLVKEYYFRLSAITRYYLENRFSFRAPEMTTEEFLEAMRDFALFSGKQKNTIKEFLNHCDMVKFALYSPSKKEIDDVFSIATRLIDETKETGKELNEGSTDAV